MAQTDQASWAAYAAHIVASSFRSRNQYKKSRSLCIPVLLLSLGSLVAPATAWCSSTLWGNATPSSISNDPNAYELGVNFYADQSGFITAIRFYKGAGNTGTHIGHLWDNHGNLLSTATFTNETASGWQQVTLPTPVPITANTIYTASYWDPNGHYGLDSSYFNNQYDNAPLHAPAIQNGVYSFSPTSYPSGTNLSSNYWVDVVFSTTANGGGGGGGGSVSGSTLWGNATPSSISTDPNAYELGVNFYVDQSGFITAIRFYKGAGNTGTHIGHLWDNHGNLLSTATFTNETASGWQQVTLPTPVPITANTIYTASYWDPNGHYGLDSSYFNNQYDNAPLHAPAIQNGVYSFSPTSYPSGTNLSSNYWVDVVFSTTANGGRGGGGSVSGSTLWGNATPSSISTDPNAYELGVNFYVDQSGFITAIRFYKGAGNTGTHIGHLWDDHGNLLSTAIFTNETASGWQQVTLPTPVPITANTIYTASYWDPNGHYGLDSSYFNNQYDNAPLHAPAIQNGVYSFSPTTYPSGTNLSSNYWVDVVFSSGASSSPPPTTLTLSLAPTTLSFGVVTVGSSSTLPVVITNTGSASVTVSQANITGSGFSITGPAMPLSLGSGQNTSFNITFTPASGGNATGDLSVVSNATNSPGVTSLSATGANQHSVSLAWAASSSPGITGYNVYRGTVPGGPYTKLNAALVAGTAYTDGTVQAGQTYYYVTTAVDSQGVESAGSNQAAAVVPSP